MYSTVKYTVSRLNVQAEYCPYYATTQSSFLYLLYAVCVHKSVEC